MIVLARRQRLRLALIERRRMMPGGGVTRDALSSHTNLLLANWPHGPVVFFCLAGRRGDRRSRLRFSASKLIKQAPGGGMFVRGEEGEGEEEEKESQDATGRLAQTLQGRKGSRNGTIHIQAVRVLRATPNLDTLHVTALPRLPRQQRPGAR